MRATASRCASQSQEISRHSSSTPPSCTRRQARRRAELRTLLVEEFSGRVMADVDTNPELIAVVDAVAGGTLDAYSGVERILGRLLRQA